jgi:hypothetical protein
MGKLILFAALFLSVGPALASSNKCVPFFHSSEIQQRGTNQMIIKAGSRRYQVLVSDCPFLKDDSYPLIFDNLGPADELCRLDSFRVNGWSCMVEEVRMLPKH